MMSPAANLPRLPFSSKLLYITGMLGYVSMLRLIAGWLQKHLVPPAGQIIVPLAVLSGLMLAGRLYIDAVSDPCVGYWSDHYRGRWGRRKPFILAGAIPTVLSMLVLFLMPDMTTIVGDPDTGLIINSVIIGLAVAVFFVGSTLCAMPYLAMLPEIAPHPDDRKQVASMLAIAVVVGVALGPGVPGFLPGLDLGFVKLSQLQVASLLIAAVGVVAVFLLIGVFREPAWSDPDWRPDEHDAQESRVRHRGVPGMGLAAGFTLIGHTMLYALLLAGGAVVLLPVWLVTRWFGVKVKWIPDNPPSPLVPLGRALTTMARFKPFLGFAAAFCALHTAFVVTTGAIPYVQQTMLEGNEAANWVTYAEDSGKPLLDAHALARVRAELSTMREAQADGTLIDAGTFGEHLIEGGFVSEEKNAAVMERLNKRGNGIGSMLMGFALGSTLLIGVPLVYALLGWIGHKRTGTVCLWIFIVSPLAMPLALFTGPAAGFWLMAAICVAVGVALAGIFVLDNLLLSDVIDLDTKMTGERRESQYFGIYGLIMKIGIGLGYFIGPALFGIFGYSLNDPWGVALAGPASSLIVLIGSLVYWNYFPDHMEREHPDPQHLYIGDPMKAPDFAEAHAGTVTPLADPQPESTDPPSNQQT